MKLRFLGIIPNTPVDDSPTIWLDEDTGDLLIQSYKATEAEVKALPGDRFHPWPLDGRPGSRGDHPASGSDAEVRSATGRQQR
ncbi:hypothetical protein GCM10009566_09670 [Streptomyces murinus]|uniref:Uncharacterized protein n=1 Tax=Streptomyces murinus TaxID=33900 RepID=A0A7W3RMN1_STRMR|nr:hypothetical protein [Streptomyces murinus]